MVLWYGAVPNWTSHWLITEVTNIGKKCTTYKTYRIYITTPLFVVITNKMQVLFLQWHHFFFFAFPHQRTKPPGYSAMNSFLVTRSLCSITKVIRIWGIDKKIWKSWNDVFNHDMVDFFNEFISHSCPSLNFQHQSLTLKGGHPSLFRK